MSHKETLQQQFETLKTIFPKLKKELKGIGTKTLNKQDYDEIPDWSTDADITVSKCFKGKNSPMAKVTITVEDNLFTAVRNTNSDIFDIDYGCIQSQNIDQIIQYTANFILNAKDFIEE